MLVVCKMEKCPFYEGGFCSNKVVGIDVNGHCSQLWKNGAPRPHGLEPIDDIYKEKIIILEGEFKDDKNGKEEEILERDCGSTDSIERYDEETASDGKSYNGRELQESGESGSTECRIDGDVQENDSDCGGAEDSN